ncbi:MAG: tRNA (adenosine(37)-N6)-threonylcarbamoyltransferase complex transferase subunit TsaD, partial [Pseudomonadota bacterium]
MHQLPETVTLLGIETSCDETAAAVLRRGPGGTEILSDVIHSQIEDHRPYGGVVPEIAARAHADLCDEVVSRALSDAGLSLTDLDGIAATSGPGLIGGVLVGMMTGK